MREVVLCSWLLLASTALGAPGDPPLLAPTGFVTDRAGVLPAATTARIETLLRELQAKTGAEIAVLTVETTAPLDDFTYAMRVAEAWKPGRAREDTGLLMLLAVRDRRLRIVTGYGLEGVLPDGLVGQIQDEAIVPRLRAGDLPGGVEAGVRALAARIAADRNVTLSGVAPPRAPASQRFPPWIALVLVLLIVAVVVYVASHQPPSFRHRGRGRGYADPFGWGSGGFGGGFGGDIGGGGFGGFGGGGFGGGGAGRSW